MWGSIVSKRGLIKPCSLCVNVWPTIWILLRLNLKHVCWLQLSVQLSQGVQLTCDRIDPNGTILIQDRVPNGESEWSAIQTATTLWVILEEDLCRVIHYAPVGFVGISGLDFSYLIPHLFLQNAEGVGQFGENWWFIYICHYDVHLSIRNCLDAFDSLALQVRHCFFIRIPYTMKDCICDQLFFSYVWAVVFPFPLFFSFWFLIKKQDQIIVWGRSKNPSYYDW